MVAIAAIFVIFATTVNNAAKELFTTVALITIASFYAMIA
jgi:hypothetical protein